MITDGLSGVLVPERDEDAWVAAVERILGDSAHAAALRDAGLARVRERFDMNDVAARYLREFRSA
jgi:glycosyltransferase involved in cell wall biosynthesis